MTARFTLPEVAFVDGTGALGFVARDRVWSSGADGLLGLAFPGFVNSLQSSITDAAIDRDGILYLLDGGSKRVWKSSRGGGTFLLLDDQTRITAPNGSYAYGLNTPLAIRVDRVGGVYLSDAGRNQVYRIDPSGPVTVVAGVAGSGGFDGDGGPAWKAKLNYPVGIAVDAPGNLFIADYRNHRVRRVSPDGTTSTVAGATPPDPQNATTQGGFAGEGGPAINAELSGPSDVTIDATGNLFIADYGNHRIRKIAGAAGPGLIGGRPPAGWSPALTGDVNADGKVTLLDVDLALRGAVGRAKLTPDQLREADRDGDGSLSLHDVLLLLILTHATTP